jgi:hypothetical protein
VRFVRDNSLSIVFGVLFLAALTGQAVAGHRAYNEEQAAHDAVAVSFGDYVASSRFGVSDRWPSSPSTSGNEAHRSRNRWAHPMTKPRPPAEERA